jgi:hypothetical protein
MQIMFTMLDLSRAEAAPLFEYVQQRQVLLVTQSSYQTLTDSESSETFALHQQRVSTLPWRSRRAPHYIAKPPNDEPGQFVTSLTITSRIHSFRAIYTNLITRVPWQTFACPSSYVLVRCLSCAIGTIAPSNSVATSTLLSNTKDHICLCGHLPQSRQLHGSKWLCTQRTLGDFASCATPHFFVSEKLASRMQHHVRLF